MPPDAIVPVPDRFGRADNYRILDKSGKLVTRARFERLLPKQKPMPYSLRVMRDGREVEISEHRTITEAKSVAKKLVADGEAKAVDVYQIGPGGYYLQGIISEDGWSRV